MKIIVTGRYGQLARSLAGLALDAFDFVTLGRPELDVTEPETLRRAIGDLAPAVIVNAGAYTAVDKAESEPDAAFAVNRDGASNVATAAAEAGIPIVHISTDYVFSGTKAAPYGEDDPVDPQGVYGHSKLEGEQAVASANPLHVILRTAWVYSPFGNNFVKTMLRVAKERDVLSVVADQHGTPTYAPDIACGIAAVLSRLSDHPDGTDWRGVFHMVAGGWTTWAGFAEAIFTESARRGGPTARVEAITTADYPTPARRPANSRLTTEKFGQTFGHVLPVWQDGLSRCMDALLAE